MTKENMCSSGSDVKREKLSEEEVLESLYGQRELYLTEGASGVLMTSIINGEKVVTKHWNGLSLEGLNSLRREVEIYTYIEERYPHLLGSCLPALFLAVDRFNTEAGTGDLALITKFVGEDIFLGENGKIWMNNEKCMRPVSSVDLSGIRVAALRSLTELHRAGIMHGDVSLENMRVSKDGNASGEHWKVWWIDVGEGKVGMQSNSYLLAEEIEQCNHLFC